MPALKFRPVLRQLFGREPRLRRRGSNRFSPVALSAEVLEARALLSAGAVDSAFGNGGTTAPGAGFAQAMQSDGKSVTAGITTFTFQVQTSKHGTQTYTGSELTISRYTTTGVLDTAFGGGTGEATVSLGSHAAVRGFDAVLMQSDGKIVVVANATPDVTVTSGPNELVVLRFNTDGTLDTTFGKNGIFTYTTTNTLFDPSNAVIDPQGRIIVFAPVATDQFIRLTANGTLDNSFGTGGVVTSTLSAAAGSPGSIMLQAAPADPNNYEIVLGTTVGTKTGWAGELARFHSNGSLDTSFGAGGSTLIQATLASGQVATGFTYAGTGVNKIALEADGSIVAVGNIDAYYQTTQYVHLPFVAHFSAGGVVDTTFGNNGYAAPVLFPGQYENGTFSDVKIDAAGNIVIVGFVSTPSGYQGILARYTAAGQLDPAFGGGQGYVYFGPAESSGAFYTTSFGRPSLAIDPYGNIIVDANNIGGQTLYGFMGS